MATTGTMTTQISGWGRYPRQACTLSRPERYRDLEATCGTVIARGQGRSYGDASLNEGGQVILTERLNRVREFDAQSGVLRAEAGATLEEILGIIVPRGWFLPVTPGTKFVSLGGCVAADVHGKNHHGAGGFGAHVRALELIVADGERVHCSAERNTPLFWATVGGMGLTGIIGEVALNLRRIETPWVSIERRPARDLESAFDLLAGADFDDVYTVAWIDCLSRGGSLGRSVVMRGHHAARDELPGGSRAGALERPARRTRRVPFDLPSWALNPLTVGAFNELYYRLNAARGRPFLCPYDAYFYPLDALAGWNRMYGRAGFVQYQCVLPTAQAYAGMRAILDVISGSRCPSFLAVLKRLGPEGPGMLSFPMAGYTLALDLPVRGPDLFTLLDRLDELVVEAGGRVYLAKDSRLAPKTFRAMYPRHAEWLQVKRAADPANRFSSSLSRRLQLESA